MDSKVLTSLSSLETKLNALLSSITSTPTAAGAPAATVALLETDATLTSALQTLRTHQANYAKILRLRAEATNLEGRVREIVQQVGDLGDEISTACDDDDDDDEDTESDEGGDTDTDMGGVNSQQTEGHTTRKNEVDYKLLLDFARRLSKYNNEAAADAAAGISVKNKKKIATRNEGNGDAEVGGETVTDTAMGGTNEKEEIKTQTTNVGIAALTQDTVSWLDETANWTRAISSLPYPSEDRIRMGLMGQLQSASGGEANDLEKKVEQILAEGKVPLGTADDIPQEDRAANKDTADLGGIPEPGRNLAMETVHRDPAAVGTEPAPRPKPKLDLDLYDPEDDDL